jgi:hypothetical protein
MSQSERERKPRRSSWIRRFVMAVFAVLLGIATTVGVSWQIARAWAGPIVMVSPSYQWSAATGAKWMYATNRWPGAEERTGMLANEHAARRTQSLPIHPPPAWSRFADPTGPPNELFEQATGWPMVAMTSQQVPNWRKGAARPLVGVDLGPVGTRTGFGFRRLLPTRLIWPGFAVNFLFYSVAWLLLLPALGWLIRFVCRRPARCRQKQGRCPACGYDLRGEFPSGCSECGWERGRNLAAG